MSQREKIVKNIHNLMKEEGESDEIYCVMAEVISRLSENIDAEERGDDEAWFEGFTTKYQTKSSALKAAAQSRIRKYLFTTKEYIGNVSTYFLRICTVL